MPATEPCAIASAMPANSHAQSQFARTRANSHAPEPTRTRAARRCSSRAFVRLLVRACRRLIEDTLRHAWLQPVTDERTVRSAGGDPGHPAAVLCVACGMPPGSWPFYVTCTPPLPSLPLVRAWRVRVPCARVVCACRVRVPCARVVCVCRVRVLCAERGASQVGATDCDPAAASARQRRRTPSPSRLSVDGDCGPTPQRGSGCVARSVAGWSNHKCPGWRHADDPTERRVGGAPKPECIAGAQCTRVGGEPRKRVAPGVGGEHGELQVGRHACARDLTETHARAPPVLSACAGCLAASDCLPPRDSVLNY